MAEDGADWSRIPEPLERVDCESNLSKTHPSHMRARMDELVYSTGVRGGALSELDPWLRRGGLDDDLLLTMIVVPKFDDDEDEGTFYCIPNV